MGAWGKLEVSWRNRAALGRTERQLYRDKSQARADEAVERTDARGVIGRLVARLAVALVGGQATLEAMKAVRPGGSVANQPAIKAAAIDADGAADLIKALEAEFGVEGRLVESCVIVIK